MTGLWQVSGRSDLTWDDSVRLDVYYVENWSITADLVDPVADGPRGLLLLRRVLSAKHQPAQTLPPAGGRSEHRPPHHLTAPSLAVIGTPLWKGVRVSERARLCQRSAPRRRRWQECCLHVDSQ